MSVRLEFTYKSKVVENIDLVKERVAQDEHGQE